MRVLKSNFGPKIDKELKKRKQLTRFKKPCCGLNQNASPNTNKLGTWKDTSLSEIVYVKANVADAGAKIFNGIATFTTVLGI